MIEIHSEQKRMVSGLKGLAYCIVSLALAVTLFDVMLIGSLGFFFPLVVLSVAAILLLVAYNMRQRFSLLGNTPLYMPNANLLLGEQVDAHIVIQQPNFTKFTTVEIKYFAHHTESETHLVWHKDVPIDTTFLASDTFLNFQFTLPQELILVLGGKWVVTIRYMENMQEVKRDFRLNVRDPKVRML